MNEGVTHGTAVQGLFGIVRHLHCFVCLLVCGFGALVGLVCIRVCVRLCICVCVSVCLGERRVSVHQRQPANLPAGQPRVDRPFHSPRSLAHSLST